MEDGFEAKSEPFGNIGRGAPTPPPPPAPTPRAAPTPPAPPPPPAPPSPSWAAAPGAPQSGATPNAQYQQPSYQPPEKKSKTGLIVGGVVLLLLVLGGMGVGAFALLGSDDSDDTADDTDVELESDTGGESTDDELVADQGSDLDEADVVVDDSDDPTDQDGSDLPLGTVSDPVAEDFTVIDVANGFVGEYDAALQPNGFDEFAILLEAGDAVEVTAEATSDSTLDTTIRVVDPAGDQIAYNDDADSFANLAGPYDSQTFFIAEASGQYIIEVIGYDATSTGPYELTVNRTGEELEFGGDSTFDDEILELVGIEDEVVLTALPNDVQSIDASIQDPQLFDVYEVALEEGEVVRLSAVAGSDTSLDPVLAMFDEDLNSVAFANDSVLSINPDVVITAPRDATYFIEVFGFDNEVGAYTFTIERGQGAELVVDNELADLESSLFIEPGETVVVEGATGSNDAFDLILNTGDQVVVTVTSTDPTALDPIATLAFGGWIVGLNDDAVDPTAVADEFDSQLITSTANAGIHTITVDGYGGSSGAFTMEVTRN